MRSKTSLQELTIRVLEERDASEVRRVAGRDSRGAPAFPLLGAERAGRLIAAMRLDGVGETVADPFVPTEAAVAMLRTRSEQLRGVEADDRRDQPCSNGAIVRPAEASCSQ